MFSDQKEKKNAFVRNGLLKMIFKNIYLSSIAVDKITFPKEHYGVKDGQTKWIIY